MDQSEELYFTFDLSQHRTDKSNTFTCSICSSSYSYEYNLRRHVLRTHINRAYISPKELATFDLTVGEHHKRIPSSLMLYSCNICQRLFADSDDVTNHFNSLHSVFGESSSKERVMIIQCPDCKSKFNNMRSLNCHMRYHRNGWTANGPRSLTTPAKSTAHSSIPSSRAISSPSAPHSLSGRAKDPSSRSSSMHKDKASSSSAKSRTKSISRTTRKSSWKGQDTDGPSTADRVVTNYKPKTKDRAAAATTSSNTHHGPSNSDTSLAQKGRQLRQRTSMQKQSSLFTCTVCKKTFHSYGNMMRHRKLSHEVVMKKRPEMNRNIKRKTKRRSKFCDAKISRKYFNRVASDIAFNVKNCLHGNAEHMEISSNCIRSESKTILRELKVNAISKKMMKYCNIRVKSAFSVAKHTGSSSRSRASCSASEQTSTMKQISQDSKSPDVYDKPGLWKFLCLVCLQYFPNTRELFEHQDTVHKRINVGYMEVGKSYELPLHSVATSKPIGCIPVSDGHDIVCKPSKYTCTKCQQQFKTAAELHPHLTTCGKELLRPLEIKIPVLSSTDSLLDKTYGKVKGKKRHWQRGTVEYQRKLTDMHGFNVRKKKRLVIEVKEQERLEKLRAESMISPDCNTPSHESLTAVSEEKEGNKDPQTGSQKRTTTEKVYKFKYKCEYCSITFKYKKVYERHVHNKCEMMKRVASPDQSDTEQTEESETEVAEEKYVVGKGEPEEKPVKADAVEDFFSPQQSLAQARVLAKFIHPARTCGPCFTCKKPNMARRYSHLQQRSDNFVEFVMSRCKNISMQSCICKACELNYKRDYDKRKIRLEKYAVCRKAASRTRSAKSSTRSETQLVNTPSKPSKQKPSYTANRLSKTAKGTANSSLHNTKLDNNSKRRANRAGSKLTWKKEKGKMSSLNGKHNYGQPVQVKSLEQIFPEEVEGLSDSPTRTQALSGSILSSRKDGNAGDFYVPVDQDIIDVEREMVDTDKLAGDVDAIRKDDSFTEKTGDAAKDNKPPTKVKPSGDDLNTLITAPRPLKKSEFASIDSGQDGHKMAISLGSRITDEEQNNARLKVILQFVNDSATSKKFESGQKLSLTEIIDAVTEKVKEDPRLAATLTHAIESACDTNCTFTRRTRWSLSRSGGVQQSKSLPSVLDGLVTKIDSVTSSQVFRGQPALASSKSRSSPSHTATSISTPAETKQNADVTTSNNCTSVKEPSSVICKPPEDAISLTSQPTSLSTSLASDEPHKAIKGYLAKAMATNYAEETAQALAGASEPMMLNSSTASEPVPTKSQSFSLPKARKRHNSGSTSNSSHSSLSAVPRKKFIMSDTSYKHMVEIIDAVACGEINPTVSPHFDEDSRSVSSTEASASQSGSLGSRCSYDFMVDLKDNLECVRTASQPGPNPHPIKNLRLANIINKLSSGSRDESKQPALVTSPTNPNSIDSGFTSLAE